MACTTKSNMNILDKESSMSRRVRSIGYTALAALVAALAACSGSSSDDTAFRLFPDKLYSGFGGTSAIYKAPVLSLNCPGTVTWAVADPSLAALDSKEGTNATFKMLKTGNTTITATCDGKTASATLAIATYTAAEVTAGQAFWGKKCTSCHTDGSDAYDDTPTQLDADTDEQVTNSFTTGIDPEGRALSSPNHKFTTTAAESKGLVAFMRSRAPLGYPEPDHGLP